MATFVIQEATPDYLMLIVTKPNGTTFPLGIREDQLSDGTPAELRKQIRQIVKDTIQAQRRVKAKITDLATDIGIPQDDSVP